MNKVYISGAITGIDNYLDNFQRAEDHLKSKGYDVINPCKLEHNHNQSYEEFMKADLKALLDCDGIYMLKGWDKSTGATCEYEVALICNIEIIKEV